MLICLINFFLCFTFYNMMITLPLYAVDRLSLNETQAGMVLSAFLLGSVLSRPFSGSFIDRMSKKKILSVSLLAYFTLSILYIFADGFIVLLGLRFVHGIFFAVINTLLLSLVNDIVPPERKGEGVGYYNVFLNMSWIFASLLGMAVVLAFDFTFLFELNLLVLLCAIISSAFVKTAAPAQTRAGGKRFHIGNMFEFRVLPVAVIGGLAAFAYAGITSFLSLYSIELSLSRYASVYLVLFGAAMMGSRPLAGRVYDRMGAKSVVYPSMALFAAGLMLLSAAKGLIVFFASSIVTGLGFGSLFSIYQSMVMQSVERNRGGAAISTYMMLFDLSLSAGSTVLGIAVLHIGYSLMYILAAAAVVLSLLIYLSISLLNRIRQE